ncbi:MAG: hypothetical protein V3S55_03800 [Nitrospiraceae bacterium]
MTKLFGWLEASAKLKAVDKGMVSGPKRLKKKLLNRLAASGRDQARKNITTQGSGTWVKLSKWTRAQTGRRKALVTLRKFIGVKKANPAATRSATVFRSPGEYTLTQHHTGFTEPATGKVVKIPLKTPAALGQKFKGKSEAVFKDNRPHETPARPVWPEGRQLRKLIARNIRLWRNDLRKHLRRAK